MARILHIHFSPKRNIGDAAVVAAIRQLVGEALPGVRWTSMRMSVLKSPPARTLTQRIDDHDLILVGGGGFCSRFVLPLSLPMVRSFNKPIVLFGVGKNRNHGDPPLDEEQRRSLAELAARSHAIGVRDEETKRLFQELGFDASLTGDPGLFLRPSKPAFAKRVESPAVGLNIAAHGWTGQEAALGRLERAFCDLANGLIREHGATLTYLVHHVSEVAIAESLRRGVPDLVVRRARPERLLYHYSNLDLVVSMMLHSAVLAVASGTPVIGVGYDDKSQAFFRDLGLSDRCFDERSVTADELLHAASNILNNPYAATYESKLAEYRNATSELVAQIAALCA